MYLIQKSRYSKISCLVAVLLIWSDRSRRPYGLHLRCGFE
jgi:hypothetical protein